MKYITIIFLVLISIMLVTSSAFAFTMSVDGYLNEWGVTPGVFGSSDWTPNTGIFYKVDDTTNNTGHIYIGPGWGGQRFDVEALYLTYDSTNLYYAVVTGFPASGVTVYGQSYVAGDIAFDFGINGTYEYGISTLNRNGRTAGGLYSVSSWKTGLWTAADPLSDPTYINSGTHITSDGSLVYLNTYPGGSNMGNDHWVIEGYVPLSGFGSDWSHGTDFRMHWTMSCGNNYINLDANVVPEPITMALMGMGLLGIGIIKRRNKIL